MCPVLFEFLCSSNIKFASVDKWGDKRAMRRSWSIKIPDEFHIDLQNLFQYEGRYRTGMSVMASILIDDSYQDMKNNFPKEQHDFWEKQPLDDINIHYAAVDGFVSYELYRKITDFMKGQRHLMPKEPKPPQPKAEYCPSCVHAIAEAQRNRKRSAWADPDAAWRGGSTSIEGQSNDWGWNEADGWKPDVSSDTQFGIGTK